MLFGDIASEVFAGHAQSVAPRRSTIDVPADAVAGVTYARFRISSDGGWGQCPWAADGEVEDYQVVILAALPDVCMDAENFDGVTAPALPGGWTSYGELCRRGPAWVTVGSGSDTAPNHVFVPNAYTGRVLELPGFSVGQRPGRDLRIPASATPSTQEAGYDGGVLEIAINGGAFQDTLWPAVHSRPVDTPTRCPRIGANSGVGHVWSGDSAGYFDTIVNLPAAAIGQSVQLRWILGTDNNTGSDQGWAGWRIDTIKLCRVGNLGDLDFDFGDAPDPTYPTLFASDALGMWSAAACIWWSVDVDADGQPMQMAWVMARTRTV